MTSVLIRGIRILQTCISIFRKYFIEISIKFLEYLSKIIEDKKYLSKIVCGKNEFKFRI